MNIETAVSTFAYGLLAGIGLCNWANRRQARRHRDDIQRAVNDLRDIRTDLAIDRVKEDA